MSALPEEVTAMIDNALRRAQLDVACGLAKAYRARAESCERLAAEHGIDVLAARAIAAAFREAAEMAEQLADAVDVEVPACAK